MRCPLELHWILLLPSEFYCFIGFHLGSVRCYWIFLMLLRLEHVAMENLKMGLVFFFPKNKFLIGLKGLVFSGHFFVTESASRWRRRAHLSSTDAQTHARTHARTYGQRRGFHLENGGKKRSRLPWNYRAPVQSNPTTCHDIFFIIIIEETSTVKMAHFDRINLS